MRFLIAGLAASVLIAAGCGVKPNLRIAALSEPETVEALEDIALKNLDAYAAISRGHPPLGYETWPATKRHQHVAALVDQQVEALNKTAASLKSLRSHGDYVALTEQLIKTYSGSATNSAAYAAALRADNIAEMDRTWRRLLIMRNKGQERSQAEVNRLIRAKPEYADRLRQLHVNVIGGSLTDVKN